MKKWQKVSLSLALSFVVLTSSGLILLKVKEKRPTKEAQIALTAAKKTDFGYYFKGDKEKPVILFAPGATVDVASYSLWSKVLAEKGYGVYLLTMPFHLSMLDAKKGEKVSAELQPQSFVLGGHSMGGMAVNQVALNHLKDEKLKGIFYLASYPPKGKIATSTMPTLVVSGSKDRDIPLKDTLAKRNSFPKNSQFVTIDGGDHLGFANTQKGTPDGDLSATTQNQEVAKVLLKWLEELNR